MRLKRGKAERMGGKSILQTSVEFTIRTKKDVRHLAEQQRLNSTRAVVYSGAGPVAAPVGAKAKPILLRE